MWGRSRNLACREDIVLITGSSPNPLFHWLLFFHFFFHFEAIYDLNVIHTEDFLFERVKTRLSNFVLWINNLMNNQCTGIHMSIWCVKIWIISILLLRYMYFENLIETLEDLWILKIYSFSWVQLRRIMFCKIIDKIDWNSQW